MILSINQTKSGGKNVFSIIEDGFNLYNAETPLELAHNLEISINDDKGQAVYNTKYALFEEITDELKPFKDLFIGSQKFEQFSVVDTEENTVCSFYIELNGLWDSNVYILYGDKIIVGYRVGTGFDENVTFYDGETIVGQLTKSTKVIADNKDKYMLHFIDGYEDLKPLLAFFTVYYDFRYHNKTGEVVATTNASFKKSLHKNLDKYDLDFISSNFGSDAVQQMNSFFADSEEKQKKKMSKGMKLFWTIFGIAAVLILFMAAIVVFVYN